MFRIRLNFYPRISSQKNQADLEIGIIKSRWQKVFDFFKSPFNDQDLNLSVKND